MKCLYYPVVKTVENKDGTKITTKEYSDCCGRECPFYQFGFKCLKAEKEKEMLGLD